MASGEMADVNRKVVEAFRTGGELPPGVHRERLLLLTTTGARTGREHVTPVMRIPDDDRVLVVASNNGSSHPPDWYVNLHARPQVVVEVGDERYEATAVTLTGDERASAWARVLEVAPFFADHQEQAGRELPLVALVRG